MKNLVFIWRKVLKQRRTSFFIMLNFVIAFTCAIMVFLFVADEFTFDRHFSKYEHIYRLIIQSNDKSTASCNFPAVLHNDIGNVAGIETFARLQTYMGERNITIDNEIFVDDKFLFGDPEILDIFDFEFIAGNPAEALSNPLNLIITEQTAEKYFGKTLPIGKTIRMDNHDFSITAVVKELPVQSHFSMNFLASISSYQQLNSDLLSKWYMSSTNYYMVIPPSVETNKIESQITHFFARGNGITDDKVAFRMFLEPLKDIHLRSVGTQWDNAIKGDIKVVYGFIVIALLIIGIAVANYINMLTANFQKKSRENSIRKINGASGLSILKLQLGETFVYQFLSLLISFILVFLLLPYLNQLTGKNLGVSFEAFVAGVIMMFVILILSVVYPVLFMQMIKPGKLINNQPVILETRKQKQHLRVRGALVAFQMVIAIALIASTFLINRQLQLVVKEKTGFEQENKLVVINPYGENMQQRYELFKERLSTIPNIKLVGTSQNAPAGYINNYTPVYLPGSKDESKADLGQIAVDHDFIPAIGARILLGKNFDKNTVYDEQMGILINESAVKALKLEQPIGQKLVIENNAYTPNNEMEIIGVIEDMQYFTLKEASKPVMYFIRPWSYHNIIVSLEKGNYQTVLKQIEAAWKDTELSLPFTYQFMDDRISSNYREEINMAKILTTLSFVTIFLSIFGILGLIHFVIQQRTKEIGIRKVNGARISEVLIMLNKDFVKWVAIAFLIATPIAYYAMDKWLENFAYKTELNWWIFALAGLLALGIALLTVSFQSWKAATRNPVEALRYE